MPEARPFLPQAVGAQIWRRSARRRFEAAPNRHAELVVLIALSGRMHYYLDGRILTVPSQSVLFAYPGQAHFLVSETADYDMYVAVFSPDLLGGSPAHPPLAPQAVGQTLSLKRLAKPSLAEITMLSEQLIATADQPVLEAGLIWWLHRTWVLSSRPAAFDDAALHPKVAGAIELIYADPGLAVGTVAEQVGMTTTRLGQLFKRQVGMTMSAFRTERRFELFDADRMIDPTKTLLAAAMDAGFADYPSFYRAHRERYGATPLRGRQASA